jgi:hypothetical protein
MFTNGTEFLAGREPNGNLIRGRDYSDPIRTMCLAIPPNCERTREGIRAALYDAGFYLALIDASLDLIMDRVDPNFSNLARAVGNSR